MRTVSRKVCTVIIAVTTAILLVVLSVFVTLALTNGTTAGAIAAGNQGESYEKRYRRLDEVYNRLMSEYYIEVDSETLLQGAIDGMMASLNDPYTFYYTPEEMSSTNSARSGSYVGIGVQVIRNEDNYIEITRVFSNGSAKEAGLMKGDLILSADGTELRPKTDDELTECVAIIKNGEIGTFTELGVQRDDERFTLSVERRIAVQDRVEYEILEGDIGYVWLYDFFGTAVQGVDEALAFFTENDCKGIIFDVRDNPGGSLDDCLTITDRFLDSGIIVYTKDRNGIRLNYEATPGRVSLPLIILVNGRSASASEIFSAAIQEAGNGIVMGETTYGKGIVQTMYQFQDGAGMQLTTSAYYTAGGKSIHLSGVTPDYVVEYDMELAREEGRDSQLEAALKLMKELTGQADGE